MRETFKYREGVIKLNLNKKAMIYAKSNNYYRPSKIKKYMSLFDRKIVELEDELKPSICPKCGSKATYIHEGDDEYSYGAYMCCNECDECFNDSNYINKCEEIDSYAYFDSIEMEVWLRDFKAGTGYKWFKQCDIEMDKMIKELGYRLNKH